MLHANAYACTQRDACRAQLGLVGGCVRQRRGQDESVLKAAGLHASDGVGVRLVVVHYCRATAERRVASRVHARWLAASGMGGRI